MIVHPLTRQLSLTGLYLSILISLVKKVDLRFNSNARLTIGSILYKNTRIILSNGSQMAAHVSIFFKSENKNRFFRRFTVINFRG